MTLMLFLDNSARYYTNLVTAALFRIRVTTSDIYIQVGFIYILDRLFW
jgi:hypothetical protein